MYSEILFHYLTREIRR